ncbi:hypothetical protein DTL21_21885 [Bremerella cremea]|uniref:Uncharacterized protein n=1 Tax=Blastopirellula marina TaxID=124 RepID=A0A2S8FKZ9_9BACT|nr:hypothetical protein C5Y83_21860 [Blastopirellula marina]RCS45898.1 hypothetical protein DTL21_21885 [Bremerella cremea]
MTVLAALAIFSKVNQRELIIVTVRQHTSARIAAYSPFYTLFAENGLDNTAFTAKKIASESEAIFFTVNGKHVFTHLTSMA